MRYVTLGIAVIFFVASLLSCGGPSSNEEDGRTVFRYNEPGGITSLDPAFCSSVENIWGVNQMFNGLVQMSSDMEVQPCIAKSWEVSDDGLVYTFHLRNDVFFHDHFLFPDSVGRKVMASDFVSSFFRIMDKETASPGLWIFSNIDRSAPSLGFEAVDDETLKIYLKSAYPPFLGILTMQYCSVVPHEVVEYYGNDFRSNPVGTGPFKFKLWKEGVKLVMVKNPNYFEKNESGERLPYFDAVAVTFAKDRHAAYLDFVKGRYDMMSGFDATFKDELLTKTGELKEAFTNKFNLQKQPFLKTDYLGILIDENLEIVQNSPLRNKKIRQAINYAIDREKMVKYLRNNIGRPATSGFVPYGMRSHNEEAVPGYNYDPDKAKSLLKEVMPGGTKDMPVITLTTTAMYLDVCEMVQNELTEVGLNVKVDVIPESNHKQYVAQSMLNFFRKSWVADHPDPENFLALFYSKNFSPDGPNYTHFRSVEYDLLYEMALAEVNDSLRITYYQKMDSIIIAEAPIVPLYYDEVLRFVQKDIEGLESNPMNLLNLKRARKVSSTDQAVVAED